MDPYLTNVLIFLKNKVDGDTYSYLFKRYLIVVLNTRNLSKDLKVYVINNRSRAITSHIRPGIDTVKQFNELRISLENRAYVDYNAPTRVRSSPYLSIGENGLWTSPNLIEHLHPRGAIYDLEVGSEKDIVSHRPAEVDLYDSDDSDDSDEDDSWPSYRRGWWTTTMDKYGNFWGDSQSRAKREWTANYVLCVPTPVGLILPTDRLDSP